MYHGIWQDRNFASSRLSANSKLQVLERQDRQADEVPPCRDCNALVSLPASPVLLLDFHCALRGDADVRFGAVSRPIVVVFNMRDGYDIYPLSGISTLLNDCKENAPVFICPVALDAEAGLVWGTWGHRGRIRVWSSRSGRVVGEADHLARVHGLRVRL